MGRAAAREFAKRGASLGLLARGADGLAGARAEAESLGARVVTVPTDVSDPEQVEKAAQMVERQFGSIDVWVNNAMVSVFSPVRQMQPEEYRRVTEVTYLGVVYGTLAALRRMLPRNQGVIIQVGSALAMRSIPLQSAYCAAKHAIRGFTASLRSELLHDHSRVRVSMVHLPAMNTPQFEWVKSRLPRKPQPVPPIFEPEVAARAIVYATENDIGREMLVAWPTVKAVFGNKVIPGLLDRWLARVGYGAQQTDEIADPARPDNLWAPLPGDHGAHGTFGRRAKRRSRELWIRQHRRGLVMAAAVLGTGLAAMMRPGNHRSR